MTVASPQLKIARAYLKGQDPDLDDYEVGIVGGPSHISTGTSYHLGKDQLKMWKDPYSARTSRDKAGLADVEIANYASALDVDDDLDELRPMSVWIVEECRKKAPDTADIREVIYSPDGVTVYTWDREQGATSLPQKRGSLSHRTHSHFDWYRDAGRRDKVGIFRRYFETHQIPPPGGQHDMIPILFGEGEKPAAPSERVKAMQLAGVRAGYDLSASGGADGRYGAGTAAMLVAVCGPVAGDGRFYGADQYDELNAKAYAGKPGPAGKTPTKVTFGPVEATVTAAT